MNNFEKDKRPACKYGKECYQKNPKHKEKYKHENEILDDHHVVEPPQKKMKIYSEEDADSSIGQKEESNLTENSDIQENNNINKLSPEKNTEPVENEESIEDLSFEGMKEFIKDKFLFEMPQDFYDLWNFCEIKNKENPLDVFSLVGFKLCGPYDVLAKKISHKASDESYLCHWRYYYDPPEFQTVISGSSDEFHIGYYRDVPSEMPAFVATMSNKKPGTIVSVGENIFAAVHSYLVNEQEKANVFNKMKFKTIVKSLKEFASEKNYSLESRTPNMKKREKLVVAKTFHNGGIVVPFDKENDVGYREIPETTASLKKIFKNIQTATHPDEKDKKFEILHELLTQCQYATDEGDFGMPLELGLDLFTYGGDDFHSVIRHLLTNSYDLLNRSEFSKIIQAHIDDRRKGSEMSRF